MKAINRIAVFTSGGDSPGMNAAVRAVVRSALKNGLKVTGIRFGYQGMTEADFVEMKDHSVSGILQRGGTILKSARSADFNSFEGRKKAFENLKKHDIDALVAIGGDGTFRGATELHDEYGVPVAGIPGTIDNDLFGTDLTVGYDTAKNTAMEAIDKIRDTADAHERLFLVEVMGREAGFLALETGIATGAELILLPEAVSKIEDIKTSLNEIFKVQRRSTLVIVAEGDETGGAVKLAEKLRDEFGKYDMRVSVLGHLQRGGAPSSTDRVLASRLGVVAVQALLDGHTCVMAGVINRKTTLTPLRRTWKEKKSIDYELLEMNNVLS